MPKVFIVDHQPSVKKQLTKIIHELGYEAQEIPGGKEVIGTAWQESMDLLLLDAELPGMDGYQVLAKLKEARKTAAIPVIMLTGEFSGESEAKALRLGANYILPKRGDPGVMRTTIRMAIKEGLAASQAKPVFQLPEEDSADQARAERKPRESTGDSIDTGGNLEMLEDLFNGGIQLGSLTMIEGTSGTGKSLICQYLTFGAIAADFDVAYYCSKHTTGSLVRQMNSINLGLWQTPSGSKLVVYPIASSSRDGDPEELIGQLGADVDRIPGGLVVIDGISSLAAISDSKPVLSFFMTCQRICKEGKTLIVTVNSAYFEPSLISRLHQVCDNSIRLENQTIGGRQMNTLAAPRINNVDNLKSNGFSFRVESGSGIHALPIFGVKV